MAIQKRLLYVALALCALGLVAVSLTPRAWAPPSRITGEDATPATPAPVHRVQALVRSSSAEPVLSGSVSSRGGPMLGGATVCATCKACDPTRPEARPTCTTTRADGTYAFDALRPGDLVIAASAADHLPAAAHGGRPLHVSAVAPVPQRADIVLERGGAAITGEVLDATGGPVAGAQVRGLIRLDSAPTGPVTPHATIADETGRFTLWSRPGLVRLTASAPGYAPGHVVRAAPSRNVAILLTPAASIRGTVVDAAGSTVPNVLVVAQGGTPEPLQATSDAAGAFKLEDLAPGSYRLRATGERWIGQSPATLTLDLGETIDGVEITVQPAVTIRGKLVEDADQPCPDGLVHLGPRPNDHSVPSLTAVADLRGDVSFEAVPPGTYHVSVHCARYEPQPVEPLEVRDRDRSGIVWRMKRQRSISGHVVDRAGKPVARIVVGLRDPQGAPVDRPPVQTDAEGAFNFRAVAPGSYAIDAEELASPVPVEVPAHTDVTGLKLVADAVGHIAVRVIDGSGEPVDGLAVSAELEEGKGGMAAQPRGDGHYVLDALRAGSYAVYADDTVNPRVRAEEGEAVTVRAGETTHVRVTFPRHHGRITGRVVDDSGAPLANVWVHAEATMVGTPASPRAQMLLHRLGDARRRLSQDDGSFELDGLEESGTFSVVADRPLGGRTQRVDVRPGAHVELVLAASGVIAGTAVDADGNPVRQFSIQLSNASTGQHRSAMISNPDGSFELEDVTPGPLQIAAIDPHENVARLAEELAPRQRLGGLRLQLLPQRSETREAPGRPAR